MILALKQKKYCISQKRASKLDAVDSMISRNKRKKKFKESEPKSDCHLRNANTKMIIDFDCDSSVTINSLAVNKNNTVKVKTRFSSGKMLMFAKPSLMSFIYDLIKTFHFPIEKTKKIYKSYGIEKILLYHILTYTDSTLLMFLTICEFKCNVPDDKFRDLIFEVIVQNKIYDRFDTSHIFCDEFNARKPELEKTSWILQN